MADAIRGGRWWLELSRSRNPVIQLLKNCLPNPMVVNPELEDDSFLWRIGDKPPSSIFKTSETWHYLNPPGIEVDWHEGIWFKGRIPKHAFIAWVAARKRLHDESIQHLFFD